MKKLSNIGKEIFLEMLMVHLRLVLLLKETLVLEDSLSRNWASTSALYTAKMAPKLVIGFWLSRPLSRGDLESILTHNWGMVGG